VWVKFIGPGKMGHEEDKHEPAEEKHMPGVEAQGTLKI
jgi:hypothetical protein